MSDGYAALAAVLRIAVGNHTPSAALQVWIERGVITNDLGLQLTYFTQVYKRGQYEVVEKLVQPDPIATTSPTVVSTFGAHTHTVPRPPAWRPLAPGDVVLVAWLPGAVDPVVIDRLILS
jgi:hypothetical protein